MRIEVMILAVVAMTTSAFAHHKPGHHIPPGHLKKQPGVVVLGPAPKFSSAVVAGPSDWRSHYRADHDFELDLPVGMFSREEDTGSRLVLSDDNTGAEIQIFGGNNQRRLAPDAFMELLEDGERIDEVAYRASGRTWFVLSGYSVDEASGERLIFYTKVMLSRDLSRLSAFEIVYPASERRRFDRIVTRIEKSLTAPG
jgi:hypothetical protein